MCVGVCVCVCVCLFIHLTKILYRTKFMRLYPFSVRWIPAFLDGIWFDTGYSHDGRADKDSYPHDGRADKDSYPHDRHNQYIMLSL